MKNIMVVDDSPGIRLLARMSLCNRYCVNSVSDAESAIELARIDPPDLFVLDIMLPGDLNGIELVKMIRSTPAIKELPVIVMSALTVPAEQEEMTAYGVNAFFLKPFSPAAMIECVDQLLEHRSP